jgi:hypothetical protein
MPFFAFFYVLYAFEWIFLVCYMPSKMAYSTSKNTTYGIELKF